MTLDQVLAAVMAREGGYVNNPADRGGPTKYGVTQAALAHWRGRPVTAAQVRALTRKEARAIYLRKYLIEPGYRQIGNPTLQALVLDCAVHHGPRQATRLLQRALRVRDDGIIGPVTLAALARLDSRRVGIRLLCERVRLFGRIITHDLSDADRDGIPDHTEFAAGWLDRVADLLEAVA